MAVDAIHEVRTQSKKGKEAEHPKRYALSNYVLTHKLHCAHHLSSPVCLVFVLLTDWTDSALVRTFHQVYLQSIYKGSLKGKAYRRLTCKKLQPSCMSIHQRD